MGNNQCADIAKFCFKPTPYCMPSQGCGDPVDLYPWAADVVAFVAGPPFTGDETGPSEYYELQTTFDFEAIPNPSDCDTRLFVVTPCAYRYLTTSCTYKTNDTVSDLWDRGEFATSVTTYGPYTAETARSLQLKVGDFGRPLIRSVAFVVTLADSAKISANATWLYNMRLDYSPLLHNLSGFTPHRGLRGNG